MNVFDILGYLGEGGVALLLILCLVEVTPIEVNPIQWFGERLNKKSDEEAEKFRKEVKDSIDKVNSKLDAHIAETYRNTILTFQSQLVDGEIFTQEQWKKKFDTINLYVEYVKENKITNGQIDQAVEFINKKYQACLDTNDFVDLQKVDAYAKKSKEKA